MNARWARTSVRRLHELHTSPRNGSARSPSRPNTRPIGADDVVELRGEHHREEVLGAGQAERPQQRAHLLAEAAAADEHEALRHLRELVGELHGDAAAQAVPHDGGALVAEHAEQVADAGGVGAEAVVASGLGRLAVARAGRGRSRCSARRAAA